MLQPTISTAWEVVRYSPESNKFPLTYVEPHIYQKEQSFRNEFIGSEFYDLLIADLTDYGTVPTWATSGVYSSGDYVDYFGTTLISLENDNSTAPCDDEDNEFWGEATKFDTPCYQSLWELYLRQYFAFYIMSGVLEYATYPSGGKGVIEWMDDGGARQGAGSRSASMAILTSRVNRLLQDANSILKNMVIWMTAQNKANTCDFSKALPIDCASTSINQTQPIRRIAYRRTYGHY